MRGGAADNRIAAGPVLLLLCGWSLLFGVLGHFTFGYGPLTFLGLVAVAGLVFLALRMARWARWPGRLMVSPSLLAGLLAVLAAGWLVVHGATFVRSMGSGRMVDIGVNTECAARRFFSEGRNPYASRCQLWSVAQAPHVSVRQGQTFMWHVPYSYGYPYYPVMFLAYEPARKVIHGLDAVRLGNAVWLLAALFGVAWLAGRLTSGFLQPVAAALASLALLGIPPLGHELFQLGVTDLLLGVLLLYGFVALSYGREGVAGVLFGLSLGAKLMPALLVLLLLTVHLFRHRQGARLAAAFFVTTLAVILPFFVWNPAAFFSATTLFYLTQHAGGDSTSFSFFLPSWLRLPFGGVGVLVAAALLCVPQDRLRALLGEKKTSSPKPWPCGEQVQPLQAPREPRVAFVDELLVRLFVAHVVFVAFAPMSHLNYVWAVAPVGAVAFASGCVRGAGIRGGTQVLDPKTAQVPPGALGEATPKAS